MRSIKWTAAIILLCLFSGIYVQSAACSQTDEVTAFAYGMRLYNEGHYDMASMQFKVFVNDFPASPDREEAFYLIGDSHFRQKEFKKAGQAFLEYLLRFQKGKRAPEAQFALGQCMEAENNFDGAVEAWSRLVLVYPGSIETYKALENKARLLIQAGKYRQAEMTLRTLRDQAGGSIKVKALHELAMLYMSQKKYRAAETAVKQMSGLAADAKQRSDALITGAELYRKTGQFSRIIEQITQYLQENEDPYRSGELWYCLGRAYASVQNSQKSTECYMKSLSLADDTLIRYRAALEAGQSAFKNGSLTQAVALLEQAFSAASGSREMKADAAVSLSEALAADEKYMQAAELCESVLKEHEKGSQWHKKLMLCAASAYSKAGMFQVATSLYETYIDLYKSDKLVPHVLIADGLIHARQFNDYDTAILNFREVLKHREAEKLYPETLYLLGRTMEHSGRYDEAAAVFNRLCREFKTSSWSDSAGSRLLVMNTMSPAEYRKIMIQVSAGIAHLTDDRSSRKGLLLLLADISSEKLKDFTSAVSYLRTCLPYAENAQERDSMLVRIGTSYADLYRLHNNRVYADSAVSVLQKVTAAPSKNRMACKAMAVLAELQETAEPETAARTYREYARTCSEHQNMTRAFYFLGTHYQKSDADTALFYFTKAIEKPENNVFYRQSLFTMAQLCLRMNNFTAADSLTDMYEQAAGPGPHLSYMKAMLHIQSADFTGALGELQRILKRWPWSCWADSAGMQGLHLLMETGNYTGAIDLCSSILEADSISGVLQHAGFKYERMPASAINDVLLIQGRAYEVLENIEKARTSYRKIDVKTGTEDRIKYYEAMARLAQKEHRTSESEYLLKELFLEQNSPTTAAQLAHLFFESSQYKEAETWILKAMELWPESGETINLERDLIISMIKQGKIPQANVRITMFTSKWERHEMYETCMAQFFLEKGKAFIEKKDFNDALEQLDVVQKKYRKTDYYAEAELQRGRVLLITNKIEEALQLLTRMTQEYQKNPVIYKVYLNLGDYYFRSQQYNIALEAFSKARKDTSESSVAMVATRYLIRVHDMLRMYDSGLVLTREYVERFPLAEDIIQKKIQIGTFLMKLHEYTRAVEQLKNVKEIADSETKAEIQYWIGTCFNSMGDFRQAIFEFLQVKYLLPSTKLPWAATALYEAGQCYVKLDEPEKARNIFNKIVIQEGASSDLGRIAKKRIEEIDERQNSDSEPDV